MQSPKLTTKNLKDPSGLDPKIRALIKKLLKLIKENKNKTLNELSLYPSLSAWERDMLLKNYAFLLESLSNDMKRTQTDYFGWALLFAWFHYRQKVVVSMIPVFSPSGETVFKKPDVLPEYPNVSPELTKMFDERTSNLFNDVRQELQDGIKMDLDNAHINNWTSKKVQEKINERYNRAEKRSIMIARTEIQFVYNTFIVEQAKKDGYSSLIWVTQFDEMVCGECGPNHLKRFPISNLPTLPAHPNCRCVWELEH
jgi:SPP1 gp7 family putative phage head morphogenesis protein